MDLKRNIPLHQRLGQVISFGSGEAIKIIFELLLGFFIGDCYVDGTPIGAVENGGGTDVKEDDGVARPEIILNGPFDGVGTLIAEINGDGYFPIGPGCGRPAGESG